MIEAKPKPCKGISKAYGVKGCGKEFLYRTYGLCNNCLSDFLFDTDAGKLVMEKRVIPKAKVNLRKVQKAETREQRQKLKTLSEYEADAKKSFQKWVRLRDKGLPCISCNNPNPSDWAGGHYFDAGMYSALIFDERNCHAQCNTNCNKHRSGNKLEYRKGLIKRYGVEFVEQLESESDSKRDYKYTKLELIEKKKYYDQKIKELEKT